MNQFFTSETISDLHGQIELFMEHHGVYDWTNLTIVTERVVGDEEGDYWYSATLIPKDTASALKDLLCDEHEIIRHFWCKNDIRGLETGGRAFTEEEVELIAKKVEARADCEYGINWQYIDDIAQDIAPDAYVETAEWDDDSDPDEACERDRERHGTDGYENESESHAFEGQKEFRVNAQIGSVKHSISYHDGAKKHKDGSRFFDLETFKSKKELEGFANDLLKNGYHKI
jgi:hypothetical protein